MRVILRGPRGIVYHIINLARAVVIALSRREASSGTDNNGMLFSPLFSFIPFNLIFFCVTIILMMSGISNTDGLLAHRWASGPQTGY